MGSHWDSFELITDIYGTNGNTLLNIKYYHVRHSAGRLGYGQLMYLWLSTMEASSSRRLSLSICALHDNGASIIPFRLLWAGVDDSINRAVYLLNPTDNSTLVLLPLFIKTHPSKGHPENLEFPLKPSRLQLYQKALPNNFQLVLFATVPRSGNSWMRSILEAITGLATGTVYNEFQDVIEPRTKAVTHRCGTGMNCQSVRISKGLDPFIVKTHFPFSSNGLCVDSIQGAFANCNLNFDTLIVSLRNPIENFFAWRR